jgi:DNA polymerase III delta prime subunit
MTFIKQHSPKQIADLVFNDPNVAMTIADYAHGLRDKHLLLYGPAGSGKSIAAQMILETRVGDLAGTAVASPIHAKNYAFDDFGPLLNDWSVQKMQGVPRGYTVIDEVDQFSVTMLQKLRAFIDSTELGTIICTTNHLQKLDDPFKDRFRALLVERPTVSDWTARAQSILAAEGVTLTAQQVARLLNGFQGSARQLIEWLEDYVLAHKRQLQSSPSVEPPAVTLNTVTLPTRKTLINGRSLTARGRQQ